MQRYHYATIQELNLSIYSSFSFFLFYIYSSYEVFIINLIYTYLACIIMTFQTNRDHHLVYIKGVLILKIVLIEA